jgi:hypothetical protein
VLRACAPLTIAAVLAGCVEPLTFCDWDAAAGIVLNRDECPATCYVDEDGDGVGAGGLIDGELETDGMILLGEGEACTGPDRSPLGGDCDDEDDTNFPGNLEVCDGRDNDCNGEPDFDFDGEERDDEDPDSDGFYAYSCTPFPSVRFFLRGGSEINGVPVDARTTEVKVTEGTPLEGTLKLEIQVPPSMAEFVGGGLHLPQAIADSGSGHRDSFVELWNPGGPGDAGIDEGRILLDLELDGTTTLPAHDDDAGELVQLAFAAMAGQDGPLPFPIGAQHVGALTSPTYCCDNCDPDPPSCSPLWDPPGDFGEFDLDLADLDDLDFAACRSFGTARLPFLVAGITEGGDPCEFTPDQIDECVPLVVGTAIGCAAVTLRIEEPNEE